MATSLRSVAATARAACLLGVAAVVSTGCAGDGRELRDPVFDPPTVTVPATQPVTAAPAPVTVAPSVDVSASGAADPAVARTPIEIETLSSPANATAEMVGVGALLSDPVSVDGEPAEVVSFDVDGGGRFVVRVRIDDEGAHSVCVADACARVYTLAADAESAEQVVAKIEQAQQLASELFDYATEFPDWTVEIGGALAGIGGTTDTETETVRIHRNRGRSVDEFVRTILHQFGHVVDATRLDDAERAAYLELRGIPPTTPWSGETAHRVDAWGRQPSEDFAEMMVMIWSERRWTPRTDLPGLVPSDELLAEVALLAG